jgi:F0F1-type ATP synthase membrane subunit b/b'
MRKVKIDETTWIELLSLAQEDRVYLEGNILKVLDPDGDQSCQDYIDAALRLDKEKRTKRLEVTKQVQAQNKKLREAQAKVEVALNEAEVATHQAEEAKDQAEKARQDIKTAYEEAQKDLDYMQKRTQFELMGNIVRVALAVILGVGVTTTFMYAFALFGGWAEGSDTTLIANTWSNMFGILLTNSFSIIGTIMGVKYASEGGKTGG